MHPYYPIAFDFFYGGVILSEAAFQAGRRISKRVGVIAREIPRPTGENAGLRDDAGFFISMQRTLELTASDNNV